MNQARLAIYISGTPRVECGGEAVELQHGTLAVLVYLLGGDRCL